MKHHLILLFVCLLLLCLTVPCFAKEWHNIKPLQTTRAEVLKLLGDPRPPEQRPKLVDLVMGEYFEVDNQSVFIRWVRPNCGGENLIVHWKPGGLDDLVNQITVMPKVPLVLADVEKSNEPEAGKAIRGFRPTGPTNCIGSGGLWACSFTNTETGFGYSTATDGSVIMLYYHAADEEYKIWAQKHKPCSMEK